jgi:hypothetical protein
MAAPVEFLAYALHPQHVSSTIELALSEMQGTSIRSWKEVPRPGAFLSSSVRAQIDQSKSIIVDLTTPNFNIYFEIGYAIGRQKSIMLIYNDSIKDEHQLPTRPDFLFNDFFIHRYSNYEELARLLRSPEYSPPFPFLDVVEINKPIFVLYPEFRDDLAIRVRNSLQGSKISFRRHDLLEEGRLLIEHAVGNVARSLSIITILQPPRIRKAENSNLRSAFVAGIALAMRKNLLMIQEQGGPMPADVRDVVRHVSSVTQIDAIVERFCQDTHSVAYVAQQRDVSFTSAGEFPPSAKLTEFFSELSAENEAEYLSKAFVQTDDFTRVLSGNARIVAGKKGTGKSALFYMIGKRLRETDRSNLVLHLAPAEYQMIQLKAYASELASSSHGVALEIMEASWELLLIVEIVKRYLLSVRNRELGAYAEEPDLELVRRFYAATVPDDELYLADLSESLIYIIDVISKAKNTIFIDGEEQYTPKTAGEALNTFRIKDLAQLRETLLKLCRKANVTIRVIVDNLDKGFDPKGVDEIDILMIRSLISASRNIEKYFARRSVQCATTIFIRDDVYSNLVVLTPDRGKEFRLTLDWNDPKLFENLVLRRLRLGGLSHRLDFQTAWRYVADGLVKGKSSWEFVLDQCMMRPRFMIYLIRSAMSSAFIHQKRERITEEDFLAGWKAYSRYVLEELGHEIQDVTPLGHDILKLFVGSDMNLSHNEIMSIFEQANILDDETRVDDIIDKLIVFGFLGIKLEYKATYIWNFNNDIKMMRALFYGNRKLSTSFTIHPAFWPQLMIKPA